MIARWFLEHPRSVGETYLQHMRSALGFAGVLALAAIASFVHAFAPAVFEKTGSGLVKGLYDRMLVNRSRKRPAPQTEREVFADYAI